MRISELLFKIIQLRKEPARQALAKDPNILDEAINYLQVFLGTTDLNDSLPETLRSKLFSLINHLEFSSLGIEKLTTPELPHYVEQVAKDIMGLPKNQSLLLPGGWSTTLKSQRDYTLIYQFEKEASGKAICFSIFNGGDDLSTHQKRSSSKKEEYYPVLKFNIPLPIDPMQLGILLTELMSPRLSKNSAEENAQAEKQWSIPKLYKHIRDQLNFLNATELLVGETIHRELTTTPYTPRNNEQHTLNQLIKITFNDPNLYQDFILKFRMQALRDFISTVASPGEKKINALIQRAITTNLKILAASSHLKNPALTPIKRQEIALQLQELQLIKQEMQYKKLEAELQAQLRPEALAQAALKTPNATPSIFYCSGVRAPEINSQATLASPPKQASEVTALLPIPAEASSLLADIQNITATCKQKLATDPWWCLYQIESLINGLPLPTMPLPSSTHYYLCPTPYAPIELYKGIFNDEHYQQINECLDTLQDCYHQLHNTLLDKKQTPHFLLTQCGFLVLGDYFDVQSNYQLVTPSLHNDVHAYLNRLFNDLENYTPFLATKNPQLDQRLNQIKSLYNATPLEFKQGRVKYYLKLIKNKNLAKESDNLVSTAQQLSLFTEKINFINTFHAKPESRENFKALYLLFQLNANKLLEASSREQAPTENNKLRLVATCPTLNAKLHAQFQLETFFSKAFLRLSNSKNLPGAILIELTYASRDALSIIFPWLVFSSPLFQSKFSAPGTINTRFPALPEVFNHQYLLNNTSAPYKALTQPGRSENEIQITPIDKKYGDLIDAEESFKREYKRKRLVPDAQIIITLNDFKATLHRFLDPNVQTYVEANIFDPTSLQTTKTLPLLSALLSNNPDFLTQFDEFISAGLHHFSDEYSQLTQESLYFFRLSFLVNRYAAHYDKKYIARLDFEANRLDEAISTTPRAHQRILATLHEYRFLINVLRYQLQDPSLFADSSQNSKNFIKAYESYCYFHAISNPLIIKDTVSLEDLQRNEFDFKLALKSYMDTPLFQNLLHENIPSILAELGIDLPDLTLRPNPDPRFIDLSSGDISLQFDLYLGQITRGDLVYSAIPLDLKNHPIMKRLGLETRSSCFISTDGLRIEFLSATDEIRVLRNTKPVTAKATSTPPKFTVLKTWTLHGEKAWYQLIPMNSKQAELFELPMSDYQSQIPVILQDYSMEAWHRVDKQYVFLKQEKGIVFETVNSRNDPRFQTLQQYNDDPALRYQLINDCAQFEDLTHFEDPQFFIILKDPLNEKRIVQLLRYGISLRIDENKQVTWSNSDNQYVLLPHLSSVFSPEVACLNFSRGTKEECHVAVQPFSQPYSYSGELILEHTISSYDFEAKPGIWNYAKSARVIVYSIDNGKPHFENTADGLYLAYLYLATHEPEKAWEVLCDLSKSGGLLGNTQELNFLVWILALPSFMDSAVLLACQLKALSLLSNFLVQGKTLSRPDSKACDLSRANGLYEATCYNKINNLLDTLGEKIAERYTQFLALNQDLPYSIQLSLAESRNLLNYCKQKSSSAAPLKGALGYEWLKLNLLTLHNQLNQVRAVLSQFPDLKRAHKDLKALEQEIKEKTEIMGNITELVKREISLNSIGIPRSEESRNRIDTWDRQVRNTVQGSKLKDDVFTRNLIKNLSLPTVDEPEFINNFPYYLIMAGTKGPTQLALQNACAAYLQREHYPVFTENRTIPYWINVLYRLIISQKSFTTVTNLRDVITDSLFSRILTPLVVYQARDIWAAVLTKTDNLWEKLQAKAHTMPLKALKLSDIEDPNLQRYTMPALIQELLRGEHIEAYPESVISLFAQFYPEYKAIEANYKVQHQEILARLELNPRDKEALSHAENAAGLAKYECIQALRTLAEKTFSSKPLRMALEAKAIEYQSTLSNEIKDTWERALTLANTPPEDSTLALEKQTKEASLTKLTATRHNLLKLYLKAETDQTVYLELNHFSETQIQALHDLIHHCVTLEIQEQHMARLVKTTKNYEESDPSSAHKLASVVMSENVPLARNSAALMTYQLLENILLYPFQAEMLHPLFQIDANTSEVPNRVTQAAPGSGKTKVFLPTLAEMLATGFNTVFLEVPRALLRSNEADLGQVSGVHYDKKVECFLFDRDSDCSSTRLEDIYNLFSNTRTEKNYLLTTGEAKQSLKLKQTELRLIKPQDPEEQEEWRKQVLWLGKINKLDKQTSVVIMDEGHEGLLLKRKLNYTLGAPEPVAPELIRHSIQLYHFLDSLSANEAKTTTRNDVITKVWPTLIPTLAQNLVFDPKSPLHAIIKALKKSFPTLENIEQELINYLNNTTNSSVLKESSPLIQGTFKIYKDQIALLPRTLRQRNETDYGASRNPEKNALQRALVVPFTASDKPNESSRYQDPLESIDLSIQAFFLTKPNDGLNGFNEEIVIELIKQWKKEAEIQSANNPGLYPSIDETQVAQSYLPLFEGTELTLGLIDPQNPEHIERLTQVLSNNQDLMYNVLEDKILPLLTTEAAMLQSNAYNHVDLSRTVQVLTGTPWNHRTYHKKLKFDTKTTLGTDGYTLEVLRHKNPTIQGHDFTDLAHFFKEFAPKLGNNTRAIIDISASFAGISSLAVAKELAHTLTELNSPLKYVLYYNDKEVLCALAVNTREIIPLGKTNLKDINERLKCGPEERFTFYDEAHAYGADITQMPRAHALVLMNQKTYEYNIIQGTKRMRGLDEQQTLEFIVPMSMKNLSFDNLVNKAKSAQDEQLSADIFNATLEQMENLLLQDLLDRLDTIDDQDADMQHLWAEAFRPFLVEEQDSKKYQKYDPVNIELPTEEIFNAHKNRLIALWEACLEKIEVAPEQPIRQAINTEMQTLIDEALPYCNPLSLSQSQEGAQGLEVEVQKEVQVKTVPLTPAAEDRYDSSLQAIPYQPLDCTKAQTLNTLLNTKQTSKNPITFSPNLKLTQNFAWATKQQKNLLSSFVKPVESIYFHMQEGQLFATLISMREMHEILNNPATYCQNAWLSTTQHLPLGGNIALATALRENPEYLELMEQIQFFNGETNLLLAQKTPFLWISEAPREKLTFFREAILPIHYDSKIISELSILESILSQKTQGYAYIQEHAFDSDISLSNINWREQYSELSLQEENSLKNMALAFEEAKKNFPQIPTLKKLRAEIALPSNAMLPLQNHLKHLTQFVELLGRINSNTDFSSFTPPEQETLSAILGFNIKAYIEAHYTPGTQLISPFSKSLLSLRIMMALCHSPLVQKLPQQLDLLQNAIRQHALLQWPEDLAVTQEGLLLCLLLSTDERFEAIHFEQLQQYPQTPLTIKAQLAHRFLNDLTIPKLMLTLKNPSLYGALLTETSSLMPAKLSSSLIRHHHPANPATLVLFYGLLNQPVNVSLVKHILDYIEGLSASLQYEILTHTLEGCSALTLALESNLISITTLILKLLGEARPADATAILMTLSDAQYQNLIKTKEETQIARLAQFITVFEASDNLSKVEQTRLLLTYETLLKEIPVLELSLLKDIAAKHYKTDDPIYQLLVFRIGHGGASTLQAVLDQEQVGNEEKAHLVKLFLSKSKSVVTEELLERILSIKDLILTLEVLRQLAEKATRWSFLSKIMTKFSDDATLQAELLIHCIQTKTVDEDFLIEILNNFARLIPSGTKAHQDVKHAIIHKKLSENITRVLLLQASLVDDFMMILGHTKATAALYAIVQEAILKNDHLLTLLNGLTVGTEEAFLSEIIQLPSVSTTILRLCLQKAAEQSTLQLLLDRPNCNENLCYSIYQRATTLALKPAFLETIQLTWRRIITERWNTALAQLESDKNSTKEEIMEAVRDSHFSEFPVDIRWPDDFSRLDPRTVLLMYGAAFFPDAIPSLIPLLKEADHDEQYKLLREITLLPAQLACDNLLLIAAQSYPQQVLALLESLVQLNNIVYLGLNDASNEFDFLFTQPSQTGLTLLLCLLLAPVEGVESKRSVADAAAFLVKTIATLNKSSQKTILTNKDSALAITPLKLALDHDYGCAASIWELMIDLDRDYTLHLINEELTTEDIQKLVTLMTSEKQMSQFLLSTNAEGIALITQKALAGNPLALQVLLDSDCIEKTQKVKLIVQYLEMTDYIPEEKLVMSILTIAGLEDEILQALLLKTTQLSAFDAVLKKIELPDVEGFILTHISDRRLNQSLRRDLINKILACEPNEHTNTIEFINQELVSGLLLLDTLNGLKKLWPALFVPAVSDTSDPIKLMQLINHRNCSQEAYYVVINKEATPELSEVQAYAKVKWCAFATLRLTEALQHLVAAIPPKSKGRLGLASTSFNACLEVVQHSPISDIPQNRIVWPNDSGDDDALMYVAVFYPDLFLKLVEAIDVKGYMNIRLVDLFKIIVRSSHPEFINAILKWVRKTPDTEPGDYSLQSRTDELFNSLSLRDDEQELIDKIASASKAISPLTLMWFVKFHPKKVILFEVVDQVFAGLLTLLELSPKDSQDVETIRKFLVSHLALDGRYTVEALLLADFLNKIFESTPKPDTNFTSQFSNHKKTSNVIHVLVSFIRTNTELTNAIQTALESMITVAAPAARFALFKPEAQKHLPEAYLALLPITDNSEQITQYSEKIDWNELIKAEVRNDIFMGMLLNGLNALFTKAPEALRETFTRFTEASWELLIKTPKSAELTTVLIQILFNTETARLLSLEGDEHITAERINHAILDSLYSRFNLGLSVELKPAEDYKRITNLSQSLYALYSDYQAGPSPTDSILSEIKSLLLRLADKKHPEAWVALALLADKPEEKNKYCDLIRKHKAPARKATLFTEQDYNHSLCQYMLSDLPASRPSSDTRSALPFIDAFKSKIESMLKTDLPVNKEGPRQGSGITNDDL